MISFYSSIHNLIIIKREDNFLKKLRTLSFFLEVPSSTQKILPLLFVGCIETLGVQSKTIPDSAMTASSSLSSTSRPYVARLYSPKASGLQGVVDSRGGWSPQTSDQQQYLQVCGRKIH